jgi:hypothetical protein
LIYRMIDDIREWHEEERDWRVARTFLQRDYGYERYGGNCHMVPNHGLIIQSLLYGDDDLQKSLMIVNTSGWDTDCNSGNVGCLLGIKNGLAGLETGPDWRGPVSDRLYLSTADGGRAITDAATEALHVVNIGRALAEQPALRPKNGARFHFELPGSVQGFLADDSIDSRGTLALENVMGHSLDGTRALALRYRNVALGRSARAATATFTPPEGFAMPGYALYASPTLYPGQTVRARVSADSGDQASIMCSLFIGVYSQDNESEPPQPQRIYGPQVDLAPGASHEFVWKIEGVGGAPIATIGLELSASQRANGNVYLDTLTWDGAPDVVLGRSADGGSAWRRAWVNGVDYFDTRWPEPYRIVQNSGTGLLIQGSREWIDYRASAMLTPHLAARAGIGARVQGMRRFYGLLLVADNKAQLIRALDGETVLGEVDFPWTFGSSYNLSLQVIGNRIQGWIDDQLCFDVTDAERPLNGGGVALICSEGRVATDAVRVQPAL